LLSEREGADGDRDELEVRKASQGGEVIAGVGESGIVEEGELMVWGDAGQGLH